MGLSVTPPLGNPLQSDTRAQRRAMVLALATAATILVLLGHAYVQLPRPLFIAGVLSGVWVGIASLFSP
jgi:hypothetical protein